MAALLALAVGCGEQEQITVKVVPKLPAQSMSVPAAGPAPSANAGEAQANSEAPWRVPPGWTELPEPRPMRVTTFVAGSGEEQVEIALSRFPGDTGGLLANVNRWRGQVGLAPITDAELAQAVQPFAGGIYEGWTLRLEGSEQHMLGGIIYDKAADQTWFVKAVAPPAVADRHQAEVFEFTRSFAGDGATP